MAQVDTSTIPESYLRLIARFWLRPIRSREELEQATAVLDDITMREDLTDAEEDYLDLLTDLVEAYESEHVKVRDIHGVEFLKVEIEERGLSQADVARGAGMATTTLNDLHTGRCKLNLKHVEVQAANLKLPASVLLPKKPEGDEDRG